MLSPVILSIPLVLPLVISPPADCQFGRLGDVAADEVVRPGEVSAALTRMPIRGTVEPGAHVPDAMG